MTNAEVLYMTLQDWGGDVFGTVMQNSPIGDILSIVIKPAYATDTFLNDLGIPMLKDYIKMVPDELLPNFANSFMVGMVKTRKEDGPLRIKGVTLTPRTFESLHKEFNDNLAQYGPQPPKPEPKPAQESEPESDVEFEPVQPEKKIKTKKEKE